MNIVLLNGPPRCGKDTAGLCVVASIPNSATFKLADPLKLATHAAFGMPHLAADAFEDCKDEPNAAFFGATPRRAYINMSERGIKPAFGPAHFGAVLVRSICAARGYGVKLAVVTDAGFTSEVEPVIDTFGREHVLILQLTRLGCSFRDDSRMYLRTGTGALAGVPSALMANNDSKRELRRTVVWHIQHHAERAGWEL